MDELVGFWAHAFALLVVPAVMHETEVAACLCVFRQVARQTRVLPISRVPGLSVT
jgi:hypothetical protein